MTHAIILSYRKYVFKLEDDGLCVIQYVNTLHAQAPKLGTRFPLLPNLNIHWFYGAQEKWNLKEFVFNKSGYKAQERK